MIGVYLNTSVLVAALMDEASGPAARRALAAHRGGRSLVSDWVLTEFASAMGLKVRQKTLPAAKALEAIAFLDELAQSDFRIFEVGRADFRSAAALCRAFGTGLRAPDALHLAIGAAHQAPVLTLDDTMWRAGQALGIEVDLLA